MILLQLLSILLFTELSLILTQRLASSQDLVSNPASNASSDLIDETLIGISCAEDRKE